LGYHQSEPRPCSEALGNQEKDPARIEEAIAAHRDALKEWTHKLWPKEWAATQMNLGLAFATLSKQEGGMAQLEEAVAAYREALKVNFRISALGSGGSANARAARRRCQRRSKPIARP
jgi:tetratricopeptide (TPR) repeat protein